jgi:hypothetical protein
MGTSSTKRWGGDRRPPARAALLEPLSPIVETANAITIKAIVTAFMRLGVSHVMWCVCSQVRTPVAPVAAAMAHPMHMSSRLPPQVSALAGRE